MLHRLLLSTFTASLMISEPVRLPLDIRITPHSAFVYISAARQTDRYTDIQTGLAQTASQQNVTGVLRSKS